MDFDSLMQPGRLPEKPWRAEALVRLVAGIVFCCFAGAVVATAVRYFDQPHHPAVLRFIFFAAGAFACFVGTVCVLMSPWPYENFLGKLLALLLSVYGGFFFMWLAYHLVDEKSEIKSQTINMLISILALQGMAVVIAHFFLRDHHTGWGDGFGLNLEPRHALLVGIAVGLCALPATWGLEMLSNVLLRLLRYHPVEQEAVQILRNTDGWQNRLVLGVATIIIAPVAEEILFRGILYPFIKRIGYPRLAWWITALVFAAVHVNLATFIPLAFLAFVLIWLYEHTGNLLACIATHSLFNAANFIALYFLQN
jgi:membrane protease YdiL (CAAX protease family)